MIYRKPAKQRIRSRKSSRPHRLECLENRRLLAADSIGVTDFDVSEFMVGTVTVTPVLFESNGGIDPNVENWTPEEIDEALAKITEGVNWWKRTLDKMGTVHTLDFIIDDTFARTPVETPYEPINNSSGRYVDYTGQFLVDQGFGDASSLDRAAQLFNHQQRLKNSTDWAFTIFMVDSSDDEDGFFDSGSFPGAFALAHGSFFVTPSTRPASTLAHEMGHVFWARDEYPGGGSYTDRRGYYNAQLLNAADNPEPGFVQEISIMRGGIPVTEAYAQEISPESTLAFVGWRDSDGDGIFDFADVPLDLNATGSFDATTSQFHIQGSAAAVPLRNQNSAGVQSDITLNEISELQYRLDAGPWMTASTFGQQNVNFDLMVDIAESFDEISWRVIDTSVGVTSEELTIQSDQLLFHDQTSIGGFGFLDSNENGVFDTDESRLENSQITITDNSGNALLFGQVGAASFDDGELTAATPGVTLTADGVLVQDEVGVGAAPSDASLKVFQYFNTQRSEWRSNWDIHNAFVATFDQPVGEAQVTVHGLNSNGFARIEAYNSQGSIIARNTTGELQAGGSATLSISDPAGQISSVRVFGYAETSVGISALEYGNDGFFVTDSSGGWSLGNLADGEYRVNLQTDRLIHQYDQPSQVVTVTNGTSEQISAAARRVVSSRHNQALPEDVSREAGVSARDALLVINDIAEFGVRLLKPSESQGDAVDVNNDGNVSALDALLVINSLARGLNVGGQAEGEGIDGSFLSARSVDGLFHCYDSLEGDFDGLNAQSENTELLPVYGPKQEGEAVRNANTDEFLQDANSAADTENSEKNALENDLCPQDGGKFHGNLSEPIH